LADPNTSGTPPPTEGGGVLPPDPNLALIFNLLGGACGGYFLLGQKQKAIASLLLFIVLFVPSSCGTGSLIVALAAAVDSYLQAQELAAGRPIGQWTFLRRHL
jgi:hypothetical protein